MSHFDEERFKNGKIEVVDLFLDAQLYNGLFCRQKRFVFLAKIKVLSILSFTLISVLSSLFNLKASPNEWFGLSSSMTSFIFLTHFTLIESTASR